ncbi:hypothetical protein GXW74_17795 [Roseomonas eburnea]|uniref:Hedgehog/Intein (Hint) domain-containing protein n=1 Tax=Neoroseomonas eburnea TaxID=1346889 RepID=A0A9X9XF63_9PROT|nr:Hint domain-containing protein [Neoroseomonas eburnea]MBR0682349.1 hypothetical protein [Neoroseomonas eburnea]
MSWSNADGPTTDPTNGDDTFTGDPLISDTPVEAGAGNDVLEGFGGDDILNGGADDDILNGGADDDILNGGADDDILNGGADNDSLLGGAGDDQIDGGDGNDTLDGGDGYDQILGGNGDDSIVDASGDGYYAGGAGHDTISLTLSGSATVSFTVNAYGGAGNDLITASGPGLDGDGILIGASLYGDAGDDTLVGSDVYEPIQYVSGDVLNGGNGADSIIGGAGGDQIYADEEPAFGGTADNDTVLAGAGNDSVYTYGGIDSLDGGQGIDYAGIDRSTATQDLGYTVDGASGALLATDGSTIVNFEAFGIVTGEGNDTIRLGDGSDNAAGRNGDDYLAGGAGDDRLMGEGGNDTLEGGLGYDELTGGEGHDLIIDMGGEGYYDGDLGNDTILITLEGSASYGYLAPAHGGEGDDLIIASGPGLVSDGVIYGAELYGAAGNDTLVGTDVNDPGRGGDILEGGEGNDSILGGAGNDVISGDDAFAASPGDDTLTGGAGDDEIASGGGNDLVIWREGDGSDTVDMGDGTDRLDLEGWTPGGNASWSFAEGEDGYTIFTHIPTGATIHARNFEEVTCFAEGTRIMTARGEVPVETLRAGDLVLAVHGGASLQPLVWVGHTRVELARQRDRGKVAPVRIRAGALGPGVPVRDLRVSPEHALFLDGQLVPAGLLVNGRTILREIWCPNVTYYHLELASHGLVVADGAVAETYLDDGNRHLFDNSRLAALAVDFAALRANGRYLAAACAPVVREGDPALDGIRLRLAASLRELEPCVA